jgi:hypothetical protein
MCQAVSIEYLFMIQLQNSAINKPRRILFKYLKLRIVHFLYVCIIYDVDRLLVA